MGGSPSCRWPRRRCSSTLLVPLFAACSSTRHAWLGQHAIFAVLVTLVGSTVMGFSFQVWAQKHTSSSHAAILLSLEPVFAVVTSWLLSRERMVLGPRLAGRPILVGILLAELKGSLRLRQNLPNQSLIRRI